MELVYCYIKEFKGLKNREINFGWKYRFSFDEKSNVVTISEDYDYIENLFSDRVTNMSILVGENGAGKSSIVEFLTHYLSSGNNFEEPDAIIIHYARDLDTVIIYLGRSFENDFQIAHGKEFSSQKVTTTKMHDSASIGDIVYYTNSFYDRIGDYNLQGLFNLSLNSMMFYHDAKNVFSNNISVANITDLQMGFRFKEYWRIFRLFQSKIDLGIDIQLPKYLVILNNYNKTNLLLQRVRNNEVVATDMLDYFHSVESYFRALNKKEEKTAEKFLNGLEQNIVFDYFFHHYNDLPEDAYILEGLPIKSTVMMEKILDKKSFERAAELLSFLRRLIEKNGEFQSDNALWFSLQDIEEASAEQLFELMKKSHQWDSDFLSVAFSFSVAKLDELSSGEMSFVTMFARFYSLYKLEQRFANKIVEGNLLVIIDEGDLYLHPSWQKKFVSILIRVLPKIFDAAPVQIILTSHSPIILSDLPKSKVVFLSQESRENSSEEFFEHKQTFASNIHTLLADSFFLKNGYIGDFAKEIIDSVIKDLNSAKNVENKRRTDIKKNNILCRGADN